jgi:hypothetical protein
LHSLSGWEASAALGAEGRDQFQHAKFTMVDHENKAGDFWWFPYQDEEAYPG